MAITITPNMSLPVPVAGQESGPQYALDINSCMAILDSHNHTAGYGVQIPPAGLDINSDLTFQGNNAINLRTVRFNAQSAPISAVSPDIGCIYVSSLDLYYNDESGNQIQLTKNGAVNATSFGIVSGTASAAFVGGTLVVDSAANTGADIFCASLILSNNVANSKTLTLNPPNSLGANYDITLPTLPASQSFVTMDAAGNMAAPYTVAQVLVPTGAVLPFAGSVPPTSYLFCNGASVSTTTYAALFAVIGYTYGGSGSSFNLPQMAGLVPVGVGGTIGASLGGTGGEATHTLSNAEIPSHTHPVDPNNSIITAVTGGGINQGSGSTSTHTAHDLGYTTGPDGGGGAHNNVQPYLALNYIIKT